MEFVGGVLADLGEIVVARQDFRHRFFYYYSGVHESRVGGSMGHNNLRCWDESLKKGAIYDCKDVLVLREDSVDTGCECKLDGLLNHPLILPYTAS